MSYNRLRILYAEDDNEVAQSVSRAISLNPHIDSIDVACDGEELIELYNKNDGEYDILITDIRMPKLNGIDAIKKIKEKNPELFTVITTAFNENEYLVKSIQLNIDKYLLKPLDLRELFSVVDLYNKNKKLEEDYSLQKDMLIIQSKAATMGYMLDAVAHQWKQPLSMISILNSTIRYQLDNDMMEKEKLKNFTIDIDNAIEHMSDTLFEFRTFMRPDRIKANFSIKECLEKVKKIIKYDLSKKSVELSLDVKNDFLINGFSNQFVHIILNFISNSIDAFEDNNVKNKEIKISLEKKEDKNLIIYKDNAGGIPEEVLSKIFELNFSTKSPENGTGVGLFLCHQIALNHDANIEVKNTSDNGVIFIVAVEKM